MAEIKGNIGVTTENIFPIIKKFLYSEHEIFLRELVSNAVDACQKLKTISIAGEYDGENENLKVEVILDKENKTITIRDNGIGMTLKEVEKYINQIAFSSAGDFLDKYKNSENAIIGHFGLGFYSSFMVSEKVEIITKSYQRDAKAVKWSCTGSPEYSMIETEKESIGTDIILYIDKDSEEFLEKNRIENMLNKFCKFLPVKVVYGKKTEWKDGKEQETEEDNVINNTSPAWKLKPADLKDEDYKSFYRELYPMNFEEPLFNIHLNVDYPFNLTGILYFPRIKTNLDMNKNKIQLYCNQVFVTDSVEGIVPEFLTLLHGVIDSPDIPLNVSRSYLQTDSNVKKISSHISKKVADRLAEIFKEDRPGFEKKWDDLKLFIEFGMISDEKFYERAENFALFKTVDKKYFTFEEYKEKIKENQTDKDNQLIYIYATNAEEQYSYIKSAKDKAYDVLLLDGQLDMHFINTLESKHKDSRFVRVDSDTIDNLIRKDEKTPSVLSDTEQENIRKAYYSVIDEGKEYRISVDAMCENEMPVMIVKDEFMRRMKEMSEVSGGAGFYRDLPDDYRVVINTNHPVIVDLSNKLEKRNASKIALLNQQIETLSSEKSAIEEKINELKEDEKPKIDVEKIEEIAEKIKQVNKNKEDILTEFGKKQKIVGQTYDLALLANGLLKGESLSKFVNRSIDLLKK